jgi:parallel beta-helix repeat protein
MASVTVTNYDKNGITCDDAGTTCRINNSTVTGIGATSSTASNGIQGFGAKSIELTNDTVSANTYTGPSYISTGVLFYNDLASSATSVIANSDDVGIYDVNDGSDPSGTTISISNSTASDATNVNGLGGLGVGVDSATAGTVEGNTLMSDPGDGLALYGSSNLTVSGNTANKSYDGIYIGGPGTSVSNSTSNTVTSNATNNNTNDGIHADADTSGNTFSSNRAKSDINFDFQDASTGTGTAGTANTWTSDVCHPAIDSSPEGLC